MAGDVPDYPLPNWVCSEDVLVGGAQRLHEASVGFASDGGSSQPPVKFPSEVMRRNDSAPHQLVFDHGKIVGLSSSTTVHPDTVCETLS